MSEESRTERKAKELGLTPQQLKLVSDMTGIGEHSIIKTLHAAKLANLIGMNNTFDGELSRAAARIGKEIREAYGFLREKNQTIPSETLDFMLDASFERLNRLQPKESEVITPQPTENGTERVFSLENMYMLAAKVVNDIAANRMNGDWNMRTTAKMMADEYIQSLPVTLPKETGGLSKEVSEDYFYRALCNECGYMSGYGLYMTAENKEAAAAAKALKIAEKSCCSEDIYMEVLRRGGKLTMHDQEGEGAETKSITLKDVHERVGKADKGTLDEMKNENDDAGTADCILQTVFFQEIIFG